MTILAYDQDLLMALADEPFFPDKETAATFSHQEQTPLEIEEWQNYFVKFYDNDAPSFLKKAGWVQREYKSGVWELNFRNFVGLSRIGGLHLKIRNKKISNRLYQAMLDELAGEYASLVFSFGTPVGQHYKKEGIGKDSAFVEYLFLCKHLLHQSPDLEAIGNLLVSDPHRTLEKSSQRCTIDECQVVGANIMDAITNSPMAILRDNHPLQQTNLAGVIRSRSGKSLYPVNAIREIKFLNVDTNENRFVKFFLQNLLAKVESLQNELVGESVSYFNPEINENLGCLSKKLNHFLSHNIWRDVGVMQMIPASSQVLQRKDGYRQLFSLYSLLQLATHCDFIETDFTNLIEIKDVPTLYEYWCFFQIKNVVDSLSPIVNISRFINKNPLEHELSAGLCIDYECGLKLFFNKDYQRSAGCRNSEDAKSYAPLGVSYSHNLRPDIIVTKNDKKLIFDAKYKGKGGRPSFYCESDENGTIRNWKPEDIDKMHCYRDALRGGVGCFILYPGTQDVIFPAHNASTFFDGVGALSLRPGLDKKSGVSANSNIREIISGFWKMDHDI